MEVLGGAYHDSATKQWGSRSFSIPNQIRFRNYRSTLTELRQTYTGGAERIIIALFRRKNTPRRSRFGENLI